MMTETELPTDRRLHLKLKIKELMTEARNSHEAENKLKRHARHLIKAKRRAEAAAPLREYASLREHRVVIVRDAARHSQLAYAFIRGMPYRVVESLCREGNDPDLRRLSNFVAKFLAPSHTAEISDVTRVEVRLKVQEWLLVPAA
jgi:hypothetical protein